MFGMYGTFILVPLYCQQIAGYTPLLAGFVLSTQGLGTFASILLAGRLFNRIDARILVALGCLIGGYGCWCMAQFNTQIDFWNIALPGMYRGFSSGLIFVPMTTFSLATVSRENMGEATGLTNLLRNLGGSVGISTITTLVSRSAQTHQALLVGQMSQYNPVFNAQLAKIQGALTPQIGSTAAHEQSYGLMYQTLQQQASLLSYLDQFRTLVIVCLLCAPLVFLFKRPKRAAVPRDLAAAH